MYYLVNLLTPRAFLSSWGQREILGMNLAALGWIAALFIALVLGSHFTAAFADDRKIRHSVQMLFYYLALMIGGAIGLSISLALVGPAAREFYLSQIDLSVKNLAMWVPAFMILATTAVLVGGWSEQMMTSMARWLHGRVKEIYKTAAGKRIVAQGPWRYPTLAGLWWLIGSGFLLTCWVPIVSAGRVLDAIGYIVLWRACWVMARRRSAPYAMEAIDDAEDPPIVFLRSFRHDGRRVGEGWWYDYTRGFLVLFTPTPEERLARSIKKFGPFVAVGKPGEDLPESGAARMYVGDADWQAVVADLLRKRQSIAFLQAGETQGLRWELTRIGQELHAEQVILFIPFGIWFGRRKRDELYNEFRIWAEECLPTRLPEEIGKARFIYFTTVGLGWRAHLLMRKGKIVARHPLWPVLESLQKTKSIWPGSGTILEKIVATTFGTVLVITIIAVILAVVAVTWLALH